MGLRFEWHTRLHLRQFAFWAFSNHLYLCFVGYVRKTSVSLGHCHCYDFVLTKKILIEHQSWESLAWLSFPCPNWRAMRGGRIEWILSCDTFEWKKTWRTSHKGIIDIWDRNRIISALTIASTALLGPHIGTDFYCYRYYYFYYCDRKSEAKN